MDNLPIIQKKYFRICNKSKFTDRISIKHLHSKKKLLRLEQRRQKQLLMLMYIYSKHNNEQYVGGRQTHSANKFMLKIETKIETKYENSPFYRGTELWNKLQRDTQFSDNV